MVKTLLLNAGCIGSIPGWGTKIPHVVQGGQKIKTKEKHESLPLCSVGLCWAIVRQSASLIIAQPQDQGKSPELATKISVIYWVGNLISPKQSPGTAPHRGHRVGS